MAGTTEAMMNADRTPGSVPSLDKLAAVAMMEAEAMKADAAGQNSAASAACPTGKAKMNELFKSNGCFGRAGETAVAGALMDIMRTSSSTSPFHDTEQTKTDFGQWNHRPRVSPKVSSPLQEKNMNRDENKPSNKATVRTCNSEDGVGASSEETVDFCGRSSESELHLTLTASVGNGSGTSGARAHADKASAAFENATPCSSRAANPEAVRHGEIGANGEEKEGSRGSRSRVPVPISGRAAKSSDKIAIKRAAFSKSSLSVSERKKTECLQSQPPTHQHKKGPRDIVREKCLRGKKPKDTRQKQPQKEQSKDGNQNSVAVSTEWIQNYIELQKYYQIHGDCKVSTKGLFKNKPLAKWVAKQKREYKRWRTLQAQGHGHVDRRNDNGIEIAGDMTEERIRLLENIGMEWDDSKGESRKKVHVSNSKPAKHGSDSCHHIDHHDRLNGSHHNVSRSNEAYGDDAEQANHIINPNKGSGNGPPPVQNVITSDNHNDSNRLLDSMPDGEWKTKFHELVEFHKIHGHTRVPQTYPPNPSLGFWTLVQRRQHKLYLRNKCPRITTEQIRLLEGLGFEWKTAEMQEWKKKFQELQLFKSRYGHLRVFNTGKEYEELARFCAKQREEKKRLDGGEPCNMTMEMLRKLDKIGFHWCDVNGETEASTDTNEAKSPEHNFDPPKKPTSAADTENPTLTKPLLKTGYRKRKFISFCKHSCKSESSSSAQSDQPYIESTHLPKRIQFRTHHLDEEISPASENGSDEVDTKRAADGDIVGKKNTQSEYSKTAKKDACEDAEVILAFPSSESTSLSNLQQARGETTVGETTNVKMSSTTAVKPLEKTGYRGATTFAPTAEYSAASLSQAKPPEAVQANNKSANVQVTNYSGLTPRNTVTANVPVAVQSNTPFSGHEIILALQQFLASQNGVAQNILQQPQRNGHQSNNLLQAPNPFEQFLQQQSQLQSLQLQFQQPALNAQFAAAMQCLLMAKQQQNSNLGIGMQMPMLQQPSLGQPGADIGFAAASSASAASYRADGYNARKMTFGSAANNESSIPVNAGKKSEHQNLKRKTSVSQELPPKVGKPVAKSKTTSRLSTGKGEQWFRRYNELKAYKVKNGHCNVPRRYKENPVLGTWVCNQRSRRRLMLEGKPSCMTSDRIRLLEELGFDWHPTTGPHSR